MIDFLFIELYIRKKYNIYVEEYFDIAKMSVSGWRSSNKVPNRRIQEFYEREGERDILEYFKEIYNLIK
jgi:hypothetical protein